MRATPPPSSSGRHGSTLNVVGSGIAIMSDSSIALKPVIEEPSKPMPPSKASSSSLGVDARTTSAGPRMSVNQRRMKRMPRSSTSALTSSGVCGRSAMAARQARLDQRWRRRGGRAVEAQSNQRSAQRLELGQRGRRARGPCSVSSYSTLSGSSPLTWRSTIPRASSSFMRSDSSRSDRSGTAWAISREAQRAAAAAARRGSRPVQRLPTSSTASW